MSARGGSGTVAIVFGWRWITIHEQVRPGVTQTVHTVPIGDECAGGRTLDQARQDLERAAAAAMAWCIEHGYEVSA